MAKTHEFGKRVGITNKGIKETDEKRCDLCECFECLGPQGSAGVCHFMPPINSDNGTRTTDIQPTVKPDGWCMQFTK